MDPIARLPPDLLAFLFATYLPRSAAALLPLRLVSSAWNRLVVHRMPIRVTLRHDITDDELSHLCRLLPHLTELHFQCPQATALDWKSLGLFTALRGLQLPAHFDLHCIPLLPLARLEQLEFGFSIGQKVGLDKEALLPAQRLRSLKLPSTLTNTVLCCILSSLSSLESLDLEACMHLSSDAFGQISRLGMLRELHVGWTGFSDGDIASLGPLLPQLEFLDLSRATVSAVGVHHLFACTRLQQLRLGKLLKHRGSDALAFLPTSLRSLQLLPSCDAPLDHLSSLRRLTSLPSFAESARVPCLANFPDLKELSLDSVAFARQGGAMVGSLSLLDSLSITWTPRSGPISEEDVAPLQRLTRISQLSISGSYGPRLDSVLVHLRELRVLELRDVVGRVPWLSALLQLESLQLGSGIDMFSAPSLEQHSRLTSLRLVLLANLEAGFIKRLPTSLRYLELYPRLPGPGDIVEDLTRLVRLEWLFLASPVWSTRSLPLVTRLGRLSGLSVRNCGADAIEVLATCTSLRALCLPSSHFSAFDILHLTTLTRLRKLSTTVANSFQILRARLPRLTLDVNTTERG